MLLIKGYYLIFYGFIYTLIAICEIARWLQAPSFDGFHQLHRKHNSGLDTTGWLRTFSQHSGQGVTHYIDKRLGKVK